jgi:hypothetical protein
MPSQNLIYSPTLNGVSAAGAGPWVDVGGHPSSWSIFIQNYSGTVTVEVSNQIPTPYSYTSQNPSSSIPSYPPYGPPQTITAYSRESHPIAATVTVTHAPAAGSTFKDFGVIFGAGPLAGTQVIFAPSGYPAVGQYGVTAAGVYSFNADDVANGYAVLLSYQITTPSSGVVLPAGSTSGPYIWTDGSGNALVVSKSDLNVKWVRVLDSAKLAVAFLHVG